MGFIFIRAILGFLLPFLLAGMMKGVIAMRDEKDEGMGPVPYCIAMGVVLVILLIPIS